jgi:hypothetical protein
MAGRRVVRPGEVVSIELSLFNAGNKYMPIMVSFVHPWVKGKGTGRDYIIYMIEKSDGNPCSVFGEDAEINPSVNDRCTYRIRLSVWFMIFF